VHSYATHLGMTLAVNAAIRFAIPDSAVKIKMLRSTVRIYPSILGNNVYMILRTGQW